MRNSFVALAMLGAILTGCGSKTLGSTATKVPVPADTPQKNTGCPSVAPDAYHTITLTMPRALPAKIGMKFPADADLRVTECPGTQPKQVGPTASITRVLTPTNTVVLTVRHNYGWVQNGIFTPPTVQDFQIYEVKCDGTAPVLFFKPAAPVALTWSESHPNGTTCAEQDVGTGSLVPTAQEAYEITN
jgi:hypothetical protein